MQDFQVKVQDSLISGVINGVINAFIAYSQFKSMDVVPMSLASITSDQVSVWGQAVGLTFGLGIILSVITSKMLIKKVTAAYPAQGAQLQTCFWSNLVPMAIGIASSLFGWFVVLAIFWTRTFGEVMVSTTMAAVLVGVFAFLVTLFIETRTKKSILFKKVSIFA